MSFSVIVFGGGGGLSYFVCHRIHYSNISSPQKVSELGNFYCIEQIKRGKQNRTCRKISKVQSMDILMDFYAVRRTTLQWWTIFTANCILSLTKIFSCTYVPSKTKKNTAKLELEKKFDLYPLSYANVYYKHLVLLHYLIFTFFLRTQYTVKTYTCVIRGRIYFIFFLRLHDLI